MVRDYYILTKPGIVYSNVLTAAAGFLLASKGHIHYWLLLATLAGTALVIASACVVNNYIDRDIDSRMKRTRRRALASGSVTASQATAYAALLGIAGFLILGLFTSWLVFGIGAGAFFVYVVLYGITKRRSVHGTLVGSLAGSAAIVAGYCSAAGRFDYGAAILFVILACWQMPHFYAISLRRLADYKAAGLPVMSVKLGVETTKIQAMVYIVAFIAANCWLTLAGYTGYVYLVVMTALGLAWLRVGWRGFKTQDYKQWGKSVFLFSLVVNLALSFMVAVGGRWLLP